MSVFSQIASDAQSLYRDMTRTQQFSVLALMITVGAVLFSMAYFGSHSREVGSIPIMEVSPESVQEIRDSLQIANLGPVQYNDNKIWVPLDKSKQAILHLAEQNMLPSEGRMDFNKMFEMWDFTTPRHRANALDLVARGNSVARLIEGIQDIKSAKVIYSGSERRSLFAPENRQRAAVEVKTRMGKRLTRKMADTIIGLVAAAKSGLEEHSVIVTDQRGAHFRSRKNGSMDDMVQSINEVETRRMEMLRMKVEELCRAAIPGSVPWAFVDVKYDMDTVESVEEKITEGVTVLKESRKTNETTSRGPAGEVGTTTNVARVSGSSSAIQENTSRTMKEDKSTHRPTVLRTTRKVAPTVKAITVSTIVQMPYKFKVTGQTDEGAPEYEFIKDHNGNVVKDEKGRMMRRKIAGDPMSDVQKQGLERAILAAVGDVPGGPQVKVDIMPVDYREELEWAESAPPLSTELWIKIESHKAEIFFGLLLVFVLTYVYGMTKRATPDDEMQIPEPEAMALDMMPAMSEVDQQNASFESMRGKLSNLIDEDPRKAASLIRRWMVKENY